VSGLSSKARSNAACAAVVAARRRALEAVLDLAEVEVGHQRDAPLRPERFEPLVDASDEAVDARDHAVQHRLDAVDQAVRGLERQIADGGGQQSPDRLDRLVGPLECVRGGVPETDHALDGALHARRGIGLQVEEHRRGGGARRRRAHPDPLPDLDREVLQERHGLAEAARAGDEARELIDELARTDDQRADAGADQRAAQDDERRGEAADRERGGGHARDPAAREEGREGRGIGGQAADVVEEAADRDAERPGAAGDRRHGVGDGFQRGRRGNGELVRETAPDQPKPGDGIVRPLDLVGVLLGDHDAEGKHVLRRLAQRRGVDPRHGDGAFLAEELARDSRAFGGGHEALDGGVDGADPLIQRQGDQLVGREPEPVERVGSGTGPGGCLAETARQILGGLFDPGHRYARQFARTLQRLDRSDGGAERLRELGLCIDRLQAGADHRHASGGSGGNCGSGGHANPAREGRKPGVRRLHFPAEPSEASRPGLADTLQLGAHLPSAHCGEADANPFFCHRSESLLSPYGRLTF
jgi:hypothetical protein